MVDVVVTRAYEDDRLVTYQIKPTSCIPYFDFSDQILSVLSSWQLLYAIRILFCLSTCVDDPWTSDQ